MLHQELRMNRYQMERLISYLYISLHGHYDLHDLSHEVKISVLRACEWCWGICFPTLQTRWPSRRG